MVATLTVTSRLAGALVARGSGFSTLEQENKYNQVATANQLINQSINKSINKIISDSYVRSAEGCRL